VNGSFTFCKAILVGKGYYEKRGGGSSPLLCVVKVVKEKEE